jgi:hypothetical protein
MSDPNREPDNSTVEEWFGQSVDRDRELAEELSEELPPEEAEAEFDRRAEGEEEQERRHGDHLDPG